MQNISRKDASRPTISTRRKLIIKVVFKLKLNATIQYAVGVYITMNSRQLWRSLSAYCMRDPKKKKKSAEKD